MDLALENFVKAKEIASHSSANLDAMLLEIYERLGDIYADKQDARTAVDHYRLYLELHKRTGIDGNMHRADVMVNLADVLVSLGEFQQAKPIIEEALGTYLQTNGTEYKETPKVFNFYYLLLQCEKEEEKWVDVAKHMNSALTIARKCPGGQNMYSYLIQNCGVFGATLRPRSPSQAMYFFSFADKIISEHLNYHENSSYIAILIDLGRSLLQIRKYDASLKVLQKAEGILIQYFKDQTDLILALYMSISQCCLNLHKYQEAFTYLEKALKFSGKVIPSIAFPQSHLVAWMFSFNLKLSETQLHLGNLIESLILCSRASKMQPSEFKNTHSTVSLLFLQALNYFCLEKPNQAIGPLKEALEFWAKQSEDDKSQFLIWLYRNLNSKFEAKKFHKQFETALREAFEITKEAQEYSRLVPDILNLLSLAQSEQGSFDNAIDSLEKAIDLTEKLSTSLETYNIDPTFFKTLEIYRDEEKSSELWSTLLKKNEGDEINYKKIKVACLSEKLGFEFMRNLSFSGAYGAFQQVKEILMAQKESEARSLLANMYLALHLIHVQNHNFHMSIEKLEHCVKALKGDQDGAGRLALAHYGLAKSYQEVFEENNANKASEKVSKYLRSAKVKKSPKDQNIVAYLKGLNVSGLQMKV